MYLKSSLTVLAATLFMNFSSFGQSSGNSLHFDGTNDYVSFSLPTYYHIGNDFTVEMWVKPEGNLFSRLFFAQVDANNFVNLSITTAHEVQFFVYLKGNKFSFSSIDTIPLDAWTHIAATWNASESKADLYYNGVLQTPKTGLFLSSSGTDNAMAIGSKTGGTQYFKGEMDELHIWDRVLTPCYLGLYKNGTVSGNEIGLIASYNFNSGTAGGTNTGLTTLMDQAVGANNGILNNFALTGNQSNWMSSGAKIDFDPTTYLQISRNGKELKVNNDSVTYQWVDCNNNFQALPGDTAQSFTPKANGSYAVVIQRGQCYDTSDCFDVNFAGLNRLEQSNMVSAWPNPTNGPLTIYSTHEEASLKVYSVSGQLMLEENIIQKGKTTLDLSSLAAGIYIVELSHEGYTSRLKVSKYD